VSVRPCVCASGIELHGQSPPYRAAVGVTATATATATATTGLCYCHFTQSAPIIPSSTVMTQPSPSAIDCKWSPVADERDPLAPAFVDEHDRQSSSSTLVSTHAPNVCRTNCMDRYVHVHVCVLGSILLIAVLVLGGVMYGVGKVNHLTCVGSTSTTASFLPLPSWTKPRPPPPLKVDGPSVCLSNHLYCELHDSSPDYRGNHSNGRTGWPIPSPRSFHHPVVPRYAQGKITLVLLVTDDDLHRLPLMVSALSLFTPPTEVHELMVVTTQRDYAKINKFIMHQFKQLFAFEVRVIDDPTLLTHYKAWGYHIQMLVKLVVARLVETDFYLVLDADCVQSWPMEMRSWIMNREKEQEQKQEHTPEQKQGAGTSASAHGRALYSAEPFQIHRNWFGSSQAALGVSQWPRIGKESLDFSSRHAWTPPELQPACWPHQDDAPMIGVTPTILSRHISLRVLCRLQYLYGEAFGTALVQRDFSVLFPTGADGLWTEYSLYFMTAACTGDLQRYHFAFKANTWGIPHNFQVEHSDDPDTAHHFVPAPLIPVPVHPALISPSPSSLSSSSPIPAAAYAMDPTFSPAIHTYANSIWSLEQYKDENISRKLEPTLWCGMERRRRMANERMRSQWHKRATGAGENEYQRQLLAIDMLNDFLDASPNTDLGLLSAPTDLPFPLSPTEPAASLSLSWSNSNSSLLPPSSSLHSCPADPSFIFPFGLPPAFMVLQSRRAEPTKVAFHNRLLPVLVQALKEEEGVRQQNIQRSIDALTNSSASTPSDLATWSHKELARHATWQQWINQLELLAADPFIAKSASYARLDQG